MQVDDGLAALGGEQEPSAAVTDVLLGEEGEGDGQRGQEGEKKAFHSYSFSPKGMKNGKLCVNLKNATSNESIYPWNSPYVDSSLQLL